MATRPKLSEPVHTACGIITSRGDDRRNGVEGESMGLFFRSTRASDDLLEHGVRGKATVEHVWMNRFGFQANVSRKTALAMMRGDESPIRKKVRLRVEPPGRAVYDITTRVTAPLLNAIWLLAGA